VFYGTSTLDRSIFANLPGGITGSGVEDRQRGTYERADVINALRNAPALQQIAPNKPIWLLVDSSKAGVGFTVAQSAPESTDSKKDITIES